MKINLHILSIKKIIVTLLYFRIKLIISTQGWSKSTKNMLKHITVVFYEFTEIIAGLRREQKSHRAIDFNYFNYDYLYFTLAYF